MGWREHSLAVIRKSWTVWGKIKRFRKALSRYAEGVARAAEFKAARRSSSNGFADIKTYLAQASQRYPILVLWHAPCTTGLGVISTDLAAFVQDSLKVWPDASLILDGEPADPSKPAFWIALHKSENVILRFFLQGTISASLTIEAYQPNNTCQWLSRNTRNTVMRRCGAQVFAQPRLTHAHDLLGGPLLEDLAATQPIDAVFTWVNHADTHWQTLYAEARPEITNQESDAAAASRFRNNDELRFSLRSLHRNLPWIRRILIVSNCHAPAWLDTGHDRIVWVDHSDIIPPEYLPTFNSHVIESYLHHAPSLSERFLYLNDDFFVMQPMQPSDFFTGAGLSLSRLEPAGMVYGAPQDGDPDYLNAARRAAGLIYSSLGFVPTQLHQHAPFALQRSVLEEMEIRWADHYAAFRGNKFRDTGDLNVPSFMYHHYAIGTRRALFDPRRTVLIKSNEPATQAVRMKRAMTELVDFVCINEGGTSDPPQGWAEMVDTFMMTHFPQTAPWEK